MKKPDPRDRKAPGHVPQRPARPADPRKARPAGSAAPVGPLNADTCRVSRAGFERWQKGQPWIYQVDTEIPEGARSGDAVRVIDGRGWFLGRAFLSRESKISLRFLTWKDEPVDEAFFARRIAQAASLRKELFPQSDTYRVVFGEADGIPGLVVDRFGENLCVQFLTGATEQRREMFLKLLREQFKPQCIVNRSDVQVRALEGLPQEKGVVFGQLAPVTHYREGEIEFETNLLEGQKTGAFLDQRENHLAARSYAHGEALDCFSYLGGFALQMAKVCPKVTAVEISQPACDQIKANATRNGLSNVEVVCANAFDYLRDAIDEGKSFDTVVLDPPAFAKNKAAFDAAMRGYKEINLRALQLLRPGGTLITASCTYHVSEERFEQMLDDAAADAKRRVQIIERRGASRDHPVLLGLRETRYLKCFVLRVW